MTALDRNPANIDLLQSTKFRVNFDKLPGMTFFCQQANLPGVSLTEIPRSTPFVEVYVPGEKLIYDTLNITFIVDEDLKAWTEIHDWMRGITFPKDFKEYADLTRYSQAARIAMANGTKPQYGNAILSIFTNKNNANFRVKLFDVFPTSLSTILFSTQDTAENIVTADATFRFSYYDYERLR
jgi:hypothetical protein